ncbi:MAG: VWA domain-containing protein [Mycobacterium sp.]
MTDPNRTLVAVLLDRSGSMSAVTDDAEGGFATFIAAQRAQPGDIAVTLAQFDTVYEVVYSNRPVADVPALRLVPRGGTALYDGIGRLVTDIGGQLSATEEAQRPGKVIVVVVTDGHENSSREWTHAAVTAAIKRQEQTYAWEFLFLGANMDAVAIGSSLGIAADRSITWNTSSAGVAGAFDAAAELTSRINAAPAGRRAEGFSDANRDAAAAR